MSDNPSLSLARGAGGPSLPGFLGVLRGIWLMTWRTQFTPRKLPGQLGMLLILPIMVYITIPSPRDWLMKRVALGEPRDVLSSFSHGLDRRHIPYQAKTIVDLERILSEEIQRGKTEWTEQAGENPEARQKRLKDHINDCYDQILAQAKNVLDDNQFEQFRTLEEANRDNSLSRAGEVLVPWSRTEAFYHWLIDFYFFIILPLFCVRGCGPLIRDELQADTLGFLITRPIGRARLLIAKYAAQVASLEIVLLLETLLIFAAGAAKQVTLLGPLLALVLAIQILVIPAWSALGLLLGQLTGRYMAMALLYGAVVEMGIGRIPTNINTLSIIRHLQTLLTHNNELHKIYAWPSEGMVTAIVALPVAAVMFLSLAALLFSLIEYHHAGEMQK